AAGDANLIGVAFTPSRDRRDSHDIEGTLWLDRGTAELRYLEYRYTNLPDVVATAKPGGRVEFLRLSDGNWLVSRWSVRMPRLVTRDRVSEGGNRRIIAASTRLALRAVQVTGGEVIRAMRRDTVLYKAVGAGLTLQVVSRDPLVSAANATLELDATDYAATADASGLIALAPVLPGRYHARVQTPLMRSLGARPVEADVETRADARVDSLVLPTATDVVAQVCPRDSVRNGEGMLFGSVKDERARIVPNAAVTVGWQGSFSIVGTAAADKLAYTQQMLGALSDANGVWRICGVPRQQALSVRVATDSGTDSRDARLEDAMFASVDLVVHRQSAAAREIAVATGQSIRATALVEFAVVDTLGKPLPGTALEVFHGGGARALVTGPSGRALLPEVMTGAIAVRARHVGYMPGEVAATVAAGRNTMPIVLSAIAAPMLDTMRVVGDRVFSGMNRHDEFEIRRQNHLTAASITREDIEKRNPIDIFQMLQGVVSIEVREMDGIMVAASTRSFLSGMNPSACLLTVMVNGLIQPSHDLRQLPSPSEIYGVEVFAGAATIPLQYTGTGNGKMCGLIAVWTR
ncbi:MAG: TonB-dependent receptor, partial [bacterium]